jgi:hypothetical protein
MADSAAKYAEVDSTEAGGAEGENNTMATANFFAEKEDFIKKWSGPMIIGPTVPALFAMLIIVIGNITLGHYSGACTFPLDSKYFVIRYI